MIPKTGYLLVVVFLVTAAMAVEAKINHPRPLPTVLVFDIIGTCFEERNSLLSQGKAWSKKNNVTIDWPGLIDEWQASHDREMKAIREGGAPWISYNEIYRRDLSRLLPRFTKSVHTFSAAEEETIYRFWDRLQPRSDVRRGLDALRSRFRLATLSNGDLSNLHALSKSSGITWDFYFSAEQVHHFKPAREYYQYASDQLQLPGGELMMVASHLYDLEAAHSYGWQTALIDRPGETPAGPQDHFDYVVSDMNELARALNAPKRRTKRREAPQGSER